MKPEMDLAEILASIFEEEDEEIIVLVKAQMPMTLGDCCSYSYTAYGG